MVHEIIAAGELSRYVEGYWEAHGQPFVVLPPDGTFHLLATCAPLELRLPEVVRLPPGLHLCPLHTSVMFMRSVSRVVGVRIKAFTCLRRSFAPPHEILSQPLPYPLRTALNEVSLQDLIPDLGELVANLLVSSEGLNPSLREKINLILEEKGDLPLQTVANDFGVSRQAVHKEFVKHLGISPKQFASIWKFNHFLALTQAEQSLTHAAIDAGYYDQAHAIHAFHQQFGRPPSRLPAEWQASLSFATACIHRRFTHAYDPT